MGNVKCLPVPIGNPPVGISALMMSKTTCLADPRLPICRYTDAHVRVDFSTSCHFYRDFGIRGIANPDDKGFGSHLFPIPDMARHLSSTNSWLWPHTTLHRDIAFRDSNMQEFLTFENSDAPNSDSSGSPDTCPH
jgi:hypothetical protein